MPLTPSGKDLTFKANYASATRGAFHYMQDFVLPKGPAYVCVCVRAMVKSNCPEKYHT